MSEETKKRIIEKSIELLKQQGLRFSIDSLCTELRLSKKTIYKYFEDKESLATALFSTVYERLKKQIDELLLENLHDGNVLIQLFKHFQTALYFSDERIFNRYTLNEKMVTYAKEKTQNLFQKIIDKLYENGHNKVRNSCFKKIIFSTLIQINENELKDFILLLLGECLCY